MTTNNTQPSQQVPVAMTDEQLQEAFLDWYRTAPVMKDDDHPMPICFIAGYKAALAQSLAATPGQVEDRRDAERYRWWRDQNLSFRAWFKDGEKIRHVPNKQYLSDIIDSRTDEVMCADCAAAPLKSASVSEQKGEANG